MKNNKQRKFNFSGIAAAVLSVLVLVIFIPVNIIFNYYDKEFDMTPKSLYTLSSTTTDLLEKNKDKTIEIYFMCSMADIRDFPENLPLYNTLAQLEKYDNIQFHDFYPDEKPDVVESLNPSGALYISTGDIIVKCGDIIKKIDVRKIFPSNSETGVTEYAGEELLAGAIQIVTGGSLPTIYFLAGHGEKSIDNCYYDYAEVLKSDNYDVANLDLSETDSVPDNAAILVLAAPQSDLSDKEKDIIMNYSENGGAMAFFLPPVEKNIRFKNIEDILAEFELGMDYNKVRETDEDLMMYNRDFEKDPYVFCITYTPTTDSFTVDLTTEINQLVEEGTVGGISNTRSLYKITGNESPFIEKSSIITNTQDSATGSYSTISEPFGGDDETAAAAKELNSMQLELGYYSYNKGTGSKLIVLGTDDVLDTDSLSAAVAVTQQLSLSSMTWLYNSDINMNIGNKAASYDYMSFDNAASATSVLYIFIIVPICVAAVGLFVWLGRRHS